MEENLTAENSSETIQTETQTVPAETQSPTVTVAAENTPAVTVAEDSPAEPVSTDATAAAAVPVQDQPAQQTPTQEAAELLQAGDVKQIIENLLFITDRPLKPSRIAEVVENVSSKQVLAYIQELAAEYEKTGRAIRILEIGGGFQMVTKPEYGRWVRRLYNEKMTTRLSNAALETLAIIAYKQPVTRAEMEMIRGVDVAAPLEKLLERGLVRVLGKRDTIGHPMVYGTTDEFLRLFGLNKISELPDLQVFAAKQLQEKQEDLPFDEKLPPIGDPAILALEEETQDAADAFFKRPKNMFAPMEEEELEESELPVTETAQSDTADQEPMPAHTEATSTDGENQGLDTQAVQQETDQTETDQLENNQEEAA